MDLSNEYVEHMKKGEIEYLQFKILKKYSDKINHAYCLGLDLDFTTSIKGKTAPTEKLQKGYKSYQKLCEALGEEYKNVVKTTQTHTDKVEIVKYKINKSEPDINTAKYQDVDGLITNQKNLILSTTNADCILLLFYDPIKNVIGNSHSGWKGTLQRISVKTVDKMIKEFGCNPKDLICCMSPSIRQDHFEVSKDVKEMFEHEFKDIEEIDKLIVETIKGEKWNIDTIEINRELLKELGLKEVNIVDSKLCSVCNKDIIHSYRAEGEKYRFNNCGNKIKVKKEIKMNLNEKIRKDMKDLADERYKKFHSSLCPNVDDILGVRVPDLRKYAKEISKGNFREFLDNALDDYYEELVMQGLVIGYSKMDLQEKFKYLDLFVPKINSWAVCDVCSSSIKVKKNELDMLWKYILKYQNSENEFEVRFTVVMMLDNFINDEYIDKVLEKIENIKNDKYYVRMAIAWTLCDSYIKQREKTYEFLKTTKIDNWTYNKAIQKMCESFRITNEEKEILKEMKRK